MPNGFRFIFVLQTLILYDVWYKYRKTFTAPTKQLFSSLGQFLVVFLLFLSDICDTSPSPSPSPSPSSSPPTPSWFSSLPSDGHLALDEPFFTGVLTALSRWQPWHHLRGTIVQRMPHIKYRECLISVKRISWDRQRADWAGERESEVKALS